MTDQPPSTDRQVTLVTGGAGFIGSNLVGELLARGNRVICVDNFNDYYSPARKRHNLRTYQENPAFRLVEGDIRDRDLITQVFEAEKPGRVAHLAGMANVRYSIERAALYADVNVTGTINLLDAARQVGVGNFVFASTSSIYGVTDHIPFEEDQPSSRPLAPYPATKKACEVLGYAYHNMFDMNFTALRFFTAYGPRVRPDMMAYMVMDSILQGKEITLFNGGEIHRDWTYVEDVVRGVAAALDVPLGYEIMNIGRGEPVRLATFVEIIEELLGKPARVVAKPTPVSEPPITYANTEKARRLLGYEPKTSILEGLTRTWEWFQALDDSLKG